MSELTDPQLKALCAFDILRRYKGHHFYSRWEAGQVAKGDTSSYPMKTIRALERKGYLENDSNDIVYAVERQRCRCGCDLWRITKAGVDRVSSLDIKIPKWLEKSTPSGGAERGGEG